MCETSVGRRFRFFVSYVRARGDSSSALLAVALLAGALLALIATTMTLLVSRRFRWRGGGKVRAVYPTAATRLDEHHAIVHFEL